MLGSKIKKRKCQNGQEEAPSYSEVPRKARECVILLFFPSELHADFLWGAARAAKRRTAGTFPAPFLFYANTSERLCQHSWQTQRQMPIKQSGLG